MEKLIYARPQAGRKRREMGNIYTAEYAEEILADGRARKISKVRDEDEFYQGIEIPAEMETAHYPISAEEFFAE
jgi:hypothetical protein